jgi:hypothetical protein
MLGLSGYGSCSDSDGDEDTARPIVNTINKPANAPSMDVPRPQATQAQAPKKTLFPTAADMFSDGFVAPSAGPAAPSIAPAGKRSVGDAFGSAAQADYVKQSYIRVDEKPRPPAVAITDRKQSQSPGGVPNAFRPPQLKKPNTVTEDSSLWNKNRK